MALSLLVLLGACDVVGEQADRTPTTRRFRGADCARQATDSARAVCAALQAMDTADAYPVPRRVYHVFRRGTVTCVLAGPERVVGTDDEAMALVVNGEATRVEFTDSAGCAMERASQPVAPYSR